MCPSPPPSITAQTPVIPETIEVGLGGPQVSAVEVELEAERGLLSRISGFRLGQPLGAGTMGSVWSAVDITLDRPVAIKLLRLGRHGPKAAARMLREARALARLTHPNVVAVHEMGRIPLGPEVQAPIYIVMEYVEGQTLEAWSAAGSHDWRQTVDLFIGAGRGLAEAHAVGLVHRDFKPANVLIEHATGVAKVADFGVALFEHGDDSYVTAAGGSPAEGEERLTGVGCMIGTPAYMAPEQLRGLVATPASDQFALCLCLWEALHGRPPWPHASIADLVEAAEHGAMTPSPPSVHLPRWLVDVLLRGLDVRPERRFADMDALIGELEAGPIRRRRRVWAGVSLVALTTTVTVAAVGTATLTQHQANSTHSARCVRGFDDLDRAWNVTRRQQLFEMFSRVGGARGEVQATRIAALLDDRAALWANERAALCEVAATQMLSPTEQAIHTCLDRRSAELEATLEVLLDQPTTEIVDDAMVITYQGIAIGRCEGSDSLTSIPLDERGRQQYIDVWAQLTRLRNKRGRVERVELDALRPRVAALDDDIATAAFAMLEADRDRYRADSAAELESLGRAFDAAVMTDDPALTLRVVSGIVRNHAYAREFDMAAWLVRYGDGLESRCVGPNMVAVALWRNNKATLAFIAGDYEGAESLYASSVEAYATLPSAAELALGPLSNRATALRNLGRIHEARALYSEVIEAQIQIYGALSHRLVVAYNGLGLMTADHQTDQSHQHYQQARAVLASEPSNPAFALVLENQIYLAIGAGAYSSALDHQRVAQAQFDQRGRFAADIAAALALVHLGRLDEAAGLLARVDEIAAADVRLAELHAESRDFVDARLAFVRGDRDAARALALGLVDEPKLRVAARIDAHVMLATIAFARDDLDLAQRRLLSAAGLFGDLYDPARGDPQRWLASRLPVNVNIALPRAQLLFARLLWRRAELATEGDGVGARGRAVEVARAAHDRLTAADPTEGRVALRERARAWLRVHEAERGLAGQSAAQSQPR